MVDNLTVPCAVCLFALPLEFPGSRGGGSGVRQHSEQRLELRSRAEGSVEGCQDIVKPALVFNGEPV